MQCPLCKGIFYPKIRSGQQNKWYWSVIVPMISLEVGYLTDEECHEDLKLKFNPKPSKLDPEAVLGGSTTLLTTKEFSDYCERICIWALQYLGLDIPRPFQPDPTGEH